MNNRGTVNLHLVLTVFLGFGMVLFGVLAVLAYSDNERVHRDLNQTVAQAKSQAAAEQKKTDDEANRVANELPYREYVADAVDGGFKLQIPKNWSIYVGHNSGQAQLDLASNPDKVTYNLSPGAINTQAFHLQVLKKSQQDVVRGYADLIKKKKLASRGIKVSGISGTYFEGQIDSNRHNGAVIVLAVRDKTMTISTEDRTYLAEFNKIVETASINP